MNSVEEAARAVRRTDEIDGSACRARVHQRFSIDTMVAAYEQVYATIFELESEKAVLMHEHRQTVRAQPDPHARRRFPIQ